MLPSSRSQAVGRIINGTQFSRQNLPKTAGVSFKWIRITQLLRHMWTIHINYRQHGSYRRFACAEQNPTQKKRFKANFIRFQIFGLGYLEKSSGWQLFLGLLHRLFLTVLYVTSTVFAIHKNTILSNQNLTIISKIGMWLLICSRRIDFIFFVILQFTQAMGCICMVESL